MTPERAAALVARWARTYTRQLPGAVATRRIAEIEADLHDQIAYERQGGASDRAIALRILERMARGVPADVSWRHHQTRLAAPAAGTPGGPMKTPTASYRAALALAVATGLFLTWGVAAMGIIGAEGDPFDLLYLGVLAIGIVGAALTRLKPAGMVQVAVAMATAQAAVAAIALLVGKQDVPVSSVAEIVGLNGAFVALFLVAAWLFRRADRRPSSPARSGA